MSKKYTTNQFEKDLAELERLINGFNGTSHHGGASSEHRHFKVVEVDGKPHVMGRYKAGKDGNPKEAAKKAFKQICIKWYGRKNEKKCHRTFGIKETTRGSKHKVFKYEGHKKLLAKPVVKSIKQKDGKIKKIEIKHEYSIKPLGSQKGGWSYY